MEASNLWLESNQNTLDNILVEYIGEQCEHKKKLVVVLNQLQDKFSTPLQEFSERYHEWAFFPNRDNTLSLHRLLLKFYRSNIIRFHYEPVHNFFLPDASQDQVYYIIDFSMTRHQPWTQDRQGTFMSNGTYETVQITKHSRFIAFTQASKDWFKPSQVINYHTGQISKSYRYSNVDDVEPYLIDSRLLEGTIPVLILVLKADLSQWSNVPKTGFPLYSDL